MNAREAAAVLRAELISRSLARHRLVFVQFGAVFEPLRREALSRVRGTHTTVAQRDSWTTIARDDVGIVVSDLEECVDSSENVLGEVRELVFSLLDSQKTVCLVSRSPRIAFRSVPGSSVLEDAAIVVLPVLDRQELGTGDEQSPPAGWKWPSVAFGDALSESKIRAAMTELGQGLVAALDHALFETGPKGEEGLQYLAPRELEGLRGTGLITIEQSGAPQLAIRNAGLVREALASHVSQTVSPAQILPEVANGLWFVERKVRHALRNAAIAKYGAGWRQDVLGKLAAEVLRRAQLDTSVAAKTVLDLRDPLEWLTLGELMDIVRGDKFDQLGVESAIWRKLQEQLVPIRNRLAHVRMLKSEDAEIVAMWASLVRARFEA